MEPESETGAERQRTEVSQRTKIIIGISAFILIFGLIIIMIAIAIAIWGDRTQSIPLLSSLILNGQMP
jgi:dolichol kinase